jgi:nitrate reductase gamma subunit
MNYLDLFLFSAVPYIAAVVFLLMTIYRYRSEAFSYSSLSTQFLENKYHFWGMVPFHYGILAVFVLHMACFAIPDAVLSWNAAPIRLYALEITGLALAVLALVGIVNISLRHMVSRRARVVANWSDWLLFTVLIIQIVSGIAIAVVYPWGSSWFASTLSPYLWSLVVFKPDLSLVAPLPLLVKFHIVSAFGLILLFPFTRLVHVLVMPNPYLWRKTQVVRWNWNRKAR